AQVPALARVYDELDQYLIPLRPRQINALNRLFVHHGGTPAPDVREEEESPKFISNDASTFEERRNGEFKELAGARPPHPIRSTPAEYGVAYLNVASGRVYWGIRDRDRVVVGVNLSYADRRRIREQVSVQFAQIRPPVSLQNCSIAFHPVLDKQDEQVADL